MSRSLNRATIWAHKVSCCLLIGTVAVNQGCAKLNKRHKHHIEPAFGTYPASASQKPGLASVSPQMSPMATGPVIYQDMPVTGTPTSSVISNSPLLRPPSGNAPAEEALELDVPMPPENPKTVNVEPKPVPPTTTAPFAPATGAANNNLKSPAPAAPAEPANPAANTPPPVVQSSNLPKIDIAPPANLPKIDSIPPPNLPPVNDLPKIPSDLPPPVDPPKSTAMSQPLSISPFANRNQTAQVATSDPNQPVLTLSQPGDAATPPVVPAEEKAPVGANSAPTSAPKKPESSPTDNKTITSDRSGGNNNSPVAQLDELLKRTNATLSQTTNYRVQVASQEQLNGRLLPPDNFTLNKRCNPFAVRMEWSNGNESGREVIFSPVETNGMIQIRMPKGLIPRISMSPDSPLVRAKSRHPITDAGADSVVARLTATLNNFKTNGQQAGELMVERVTDPHLGNLDRVTHKTPEGETWVVDLDGTTGMPMTIHATEADGQLIEHYEFRGYQLNQADLLAADAFDPNSRWGQSSLFSKLARGASNTSAK